MMTIVSTPMLHHATLTAHLAARGSGILLYGMTPPRDGTPADTIQSVAELTIDRLEGMGVDGLVLYDIDDESDRNPEARPFPFLRTMDPAVFHRDYLQGWPAPVVVYRCVGKYDEDSLASWIKHANTDGVLTVMVGASSGNKHVKTSLRRALTLREENNSRLMGGAVLITERHATAGDEHLRMRSKQQSGVSFFISQVVYNVEATKNVLADYCFSLRDQAEPLAPTIFTLSLCGSTKTLEFLQWLGVDVPSWFVHELTRADDPLAVSFNHCLTVAKELIDYCTRLDIPFGFNIESVSVRKVEIEATIELAHEVRVLLERSGLRVPRDESAALR